MKDQYFGDFGDYQKISLLKKLKGAGLSLTVYWMKTQDDNSTDGKHITYLQKPELWRMYEPDIFDFVVEKIQTGKRTLVHIEESGHCKDIVFINKHIEDQTVRTAIVGELCTNVDSDIIFFDPDNGIEVGSTNKKNVHKYVVWNELVKVFESGKTMLVYQHFSRSNREVFIQNKIAEIKKKIKAEVVAVKVKHSVYFFVLQKKHQSKIAAVLKDFSKTWGSLATVIGE